MSIRVQCPRCQRHLLAEEQFAGARAECPMCRAVVEIPSLESSQSQHIERPPQWDNEPLDIVEFLDPPSTEPSAAVAEANGKPVVQRMLEALLDPRAIHWMLIIGGGLAVLGLVVYLVSLGVFQDPRVMAVVLGAGSLAILGSGWFITRQTRYRVVGQALTFLGCVVLPLNLWFYHAQGLVTLDQDLWLGGAVCVLFYAATVVALREPLFLYAVEAGVTLTVLLFAADLGMIGEADRLSLFFVGLAFLSIHAERAFAPDGEFNRQRYGLPFFWCGHAQLAVAVMILLVSQSADWLRQPLDFDWSGNLLTENTLLAGGLWLAATYLYLYSDLVVRRVGVYVYLAAVSLLMAEITLVVPHMHQEGLIALLTGTGLAMHLALQTIVLPQSGLRRPLTAAATVLSGLPVLLGVLVHLRATSVEVAEMGWRYEIDWAFVGVMLFVAVANRIAAHLYHDDQPRLAAWYFFFSAAGLLVAAAGFLRQVGLIDWPQQSALLMLIPLAYIIACRLWRGRGPERPLAWVAHASTAVILLGTLVASIEKGAALRFAPVTGSTTNLLLAATFLEACVFYVLAGLFRRRGWNAYFATLAGCGATWQLLGYFDVPGAWHTVLYAVLGLVALVAGRALGVALVECYPAEGGVDRRLRGRGLTAVQSGNAVLTVAFLAAIGQGLTRLATAGGGEWIELFALVFAAFTALVAMWVVPHPGWRSWYGFCAIALGGVTFLTLNVLVDMSGWQKLELFGVAVGVVLLVLGHIGRFRETDSEVESVTLGLWAGSLLAAGPLFAAMLYHRFAVGTPSLSDELGLLTVTILMAVTGLSWRIQSTTLFGTCLSVLYLLIVVGSLAYRPQVAIGVYLLIGGGVIFTCGLLLSVYREKLLRVPEQFARRERLFRVIDWR